MNQPNPAASEPLVALAEEIPSDAEVQAEFLRRVEQHVLHGGWKCDFCGFDGQDNAPFNRFCSNCRRHK